MKNTLAVSTLFAFISAHPAAGQKKDDRKEGISRPSGKIMWQVKKKDTRAVYNVVPVEVVDPKAHKKCRELIKEGDKGFMFFIVIIDNKKGKEPVTFNAFGGDATFHYYPPDPKDPRKRLEGRK